MVFTDPKEAQKKLNLNQEIHERLQASIAVTTDELPNDEIV